MPRPKQIKLKKIKDFLNKIPRTLGERAFLTFFGFLLIALIAGCLIFYKYSVLAEKETPEISGAHLQFKETTFQKVLEVWQEKEKRFKAADTKEYPDPFELTRVIF